MADSIVADTTMFEKHVYKYVAPTPPSELLDSSIFVLDFTNRKFVHVGFDAQNNFDVMIHIITPSRFISIDPEFLKRIYDIMGDIFSYILDPPQKSLESTFLDDDVVTLSKTIYRGENYLVLNSRVQEGCRVLLNRTDLFALQNLERIIFENVTRKTTFTKPYVEYQFNKTVCVLADRDGLDVIANVEDMKTYIYNVPEQEIEVFASQSMPSFVNQFKMFALEQLAAKTLSKRKTKLESEKFDNSDTHNSPSSPPWTDQTKRQSMPNEINKVTYYSPQSPQGSSYPMENENYLTYDYQPMLYDAVCEPPSYSPQSPPGYSVQSQDENDGPSFYDLLHVPSPPPSPAEFPDYHPAMPDKPRYVYQGQSKRVKRKSLFQNMLYDE